MTFGEGIVGAIGLVVAVVLVAKVKQASDARRNGECVFCGEPAEDGECDECWRIRVQK